MCGPYVEHYKLAIRAAGKQLHISPLDIRTTFAKCPSNWQSSHSVEESNSHSAEHENGVVLPRSSLLGGYDRTNDIKLFRWIFASECDRARHGCHVWSTIWFFLISVFVVMGKNLPDLVRDGTFSAYHFLTWKILRLLDPKSWTLVLLKINSLKFKRKRVYKIS